MKKIVLLITALLILTGCGNKLSNSGTQTTPASTEQTTNTTTAPATEQTPEKSSVVRKELPVQSTSKAQGMTEVNYYDGRLLTNTSMETVTLYTSAQKQNGKFQWDDSATWVLELTSDTDAIYTLYEGRVSLGNIYFDIAEIGENKYILLRELSTGTMNTTAFLIKDGKLYETNEIDFNNLDNVYINLIHTSTPSY